MKYPQLALLVPEGEHFDEAAISGEAAWITATHLMSIENAMQQLHDSNDKINGSLMSITGERDAHAATITGLQSQVNTLTEEKTTLTTERDALQVRIDAFEKKPSGTGTKLKTVDDPKTETKIAAHEADTPHNVAADEYVRRHNARKAIKN